MSAHSRPCILGIRQPSLNAPPGSLLEMIDLARRKTSGSGSRSANDASENTARASCLSAAETHAAELAAARARDGLRSYVEACHRPWQGLWPQVAPIVGAKVDIRRRA